MNAAPSGQRADLTPLHDETLRSIAASGVVRTFPRNTVLINEGDVGDALYVLLSGRVKVFSSNEAGREFVIDFHGAGEYVGEMSLDGAPRSASVITVEPTIVRDDGIYQVEQNVVVTDAGCEVLRMTSHELRSI